MRFQKSLGSAAAQLAIVLVATSVFYALTQEGIGSYLLLLPSGVLKAHFLWQPFSFALIETSAPGVIFGALITWSIGSALEQTWGPRKLLVFALGTTVASGFLTVALAIPLPNLRTLFFAGGGAMTTSLWVAYGLSYGRRQTQFFGLPLSGNVFALIGIGFVFLNGAFAGPGGFFRIVPDAFAIGLTAAFLKLEGPRMWLLRLGSWRLRRQMRSRAKHLKLIVKNRNTPDDSDNYLH